MRVLVIGLVLLLSSCREKPYTTRSGKTMGTYYEIQYSSDRDLQPEIDSLLNSLVAAASTYDSTSEISQFNRYGSLQFKSPHLFTMLNLAKELHRETQGMFEPTLMPLIKAQGFSNTKREELSKEQIDSLLAFVSFDFIRYTDTEMHTTKQGVQLDLSAMGEGYAIDMIASFLDVSKVDNYKVEIGGEMKCKGRNSRGELWLIGIEDPSKPEVQSLITTVWLEDQAISTSGKSRRFYTDSKGKKQSHIINSKTGYSVANNIFSVTVKDSRAVRADVLATALLIMGLDSAKAFVDKANIEALFIYEERGKVLSWHTPEFRKTRHKSITQR